MKKKLIKICFISLSSYPLFEKKSKEYFGGAELQMSLIAKHLAKDKRFKVTVITRDYGQQRVIKKGRLTIYRCLKKGAHRYIQLAGISITALTINADIYVSRTAGNMVGLVAAFCKVFNKKFIYMAAHDWDAQPEIYNKRTNVNRRLFHWGLKMADLIICQTKKQQRLFKKNFGFPSIVMRSVIKTSQSNKKIDKSIILWVGRADYWKRPISFIKLAQALPKEKLVMVCRKGSDVKLFNRVKNLAAQQDNVKFFPIVPIEEITKYFKQAKLFVNTSTAEGFPNTFMQSGLVKTPVLSLTVNPDDYLKRLNCGLAAKNNQKLLIKKCKRIIKDPGLIKTMGQNHYDYIIKNHSFRNINIFKEAICEKLLV